MSTAETDLPVLGCVVLRGIVVVRTGLHVGASRAAMRVHAIDAPVVRLPLPLTRKNGDEGHLGSNNSIPYIPGSSLRGKLRALLERKIFAEKQGEDFFRQVITVGGRPIRLHTCQEEACPICRLFGSVPLESEKISHPSRLYVFDLQLAEDSLLQKGSFTETKMENCLDRTTEASNPREIERISPGTNFRLKIRYWVKNPDFVEGDLTNLFAALKLLEDDALGGHGSRGYGAVRVGITEIHGQRFGEQSGDITKTLATGEESKTSVVAAMADFFRKPSQMVAAAPKAEGKVIVSLVKLHFLSPLHVGEVGIGVEECTKHYLPSDTLFSAICNAWALRYGRKAIENLLKEFSAGIPPFRVCSAFPYFRDTLFFPKPYSAPGRDEDWEKEEETPRKKLKDLTFLSPELFIKWLKAILTPKDRKALEGADELLGKIATRELLPKVRLDRIEATSNLFFCGLTHFTSDSGLFFLVRGSESALSQLKDVIDILGEVGIGGERSAGCGQFSAEWTEDATKIERLDGLFAQGPPPAVYCTLSLYYPRSDEFSHLKEKLQGYELVDRGGWVESMFVASGIQKQRCRMFREGSILTFRPSGQVLNVTPKQGTLSHEVYRYGLAFTVGVSQ